MQISSVNFFQNKQYNYQNKMANLKISPAEIQNAVRAQNIQLSTGSLGERPNDTPQSIKLSLLTSGRLKTPEEFKQMVDSIRNIEKALGNGIKEPSENEKEISKVVLKKIVAKTTIKEGEIITEDKITCKRNEAGEPASNWDKVVGSVSNKDYSIDEGIIL